jgi:hypothetical protein
VKPGAISGTCGRYGAVGLGRVGDEAIVVIGEVFLVDKKNFRPGRKRTKDDYEWQR